MTNRNAAWITAVVFTVLNAGLLAVRIRVEDRALAGTVMVEFVIDDEERPLFAIGSIIAKPLAIPEPASVEIVEDAAQMEEELEYFDSPEGEAMLEAEEAPAGAPAPPPVQTD